MSEIRKILCAVDFSDTSRQALQYAAATARWYEAQLTVLHVLPSAPDAGVLPMLAAPVADRSWLDEASRTRLTEESWRFVHDAIGHDVPLDLVVADAPQVYREIIEEAHRRSADLIVIGTHGRSGFNRLLLGSTADEVLRSTPVPVMVVPPHCKALVHSGHLRFDHILCGVDFFESSLTALTYAMSFAQEADARLTVVSVLEAVPEPAELWSSGMTTLQARTADRATTLTSLGTLIPQSVRTYCHVETEVEEGKPYREILRLAREEESDLIVIGCRSHGGLERLFLGSTASHVVRSAPCPVLAVPSH